MKRIISKCCALVLAAAVTIGAFAIAPGKKVVLAEDDEYEPIPGGVASAAGLVPADADTTRLLKLEGDVILDSGLSFSKGTLELDLNGHTLTVDMSDTDTGMHIFSVSGDETESATLRVKNGSLQIATKLGAISARNGASVSLDGVNVYGPPSDLYVFNIVNSTCNIRNCNVSGIKDAPFVVYVDGSEADLTITDSMFTDNKTQAFGGAISIMDAKKVSIDKVTVAINECNNQGGGIYIAGGQSVEISNSTITGNKGAYGGGICIGTAQSVKISDTFVVGNNALTGNGGGIYSACKKLELNNVTITNNEAYKDGDGVYLTLYSKTYLDGENTIADNKEDNVYIVDLSTDLSGEFFFGEKTNGKATGCVKVSTQIAPDQNTEVKFSSKAPSSHCFVSDQDFTIEYDNDGAAYLTTRKVVPDDEHVALSISYYVGLVIYLDIPENERVDNTTVYCSFDGDELMETKCRFDSKTIIDAGNGRYGFTLPVYITDLTREFKASVYLAGSGRTIDLDLEANTVKDYAIAYTKSTTATDELKNLSRALLTYGAYAQIQFDVNLGKPADAGIVKDDLDVAANTYLGNLNTEYVSSDDAGISYYGSTLFFLHDNTLRIYFHITGDLTDYKVYVDGQYRSLSSVDDTNFYYIDIAGLTPKSIETKFLIEVTKEGVDTSVISFEYSAKNYLERIIHGGSENASMVNLAKAACLYFMRVKEYSDVEQQ